MTDLSFDVVCIFDAEVVEHVDDGAVIGRYALERDLSILALPPEARPITYRCRVLTRDQRRRIRDLGESSQNELAFRYGVITVSNLPRHDGETVESVTIARRKAGDPCTDADLDALGISDAEIAEVGSVVRHRSFLGPRRLLKYPVLDSSQLALDAEAYHRAARLKDTSTRTAGSSD